MGWTRAETTERLTEWKRADGWATIRLRETGAGRWVVRLDRLEQAPEGRTYRRESVETRDAALELVEEWRETFDAPER
ncbi:MULTISPECIES: DUF7543 family protein [Haloprofundus]|uniref:DUF7543 family protein n=1 Tax=Haloprofundus TaxID=1911573 RepID=UPI000E44880B|nr:MULTISPECIES: hypothetical protein [Haloprofundus]QCJ47899.1 hypothetical protein FCF25_12575 [Haloprofundus sp. MHR1]